VGTELAARGGVRRPHHSDDLERAHNHNRRLTARYRTNPLKDFAPISLLTAQAVSDGDSSVGSGQQREGVLSRLAKSRPGQLNYAFRRARHGTASRGRASEELGRDRPRARAVQKAAARAVTAIVVR